MGWYSGIQNKTKKNIGKQRENFIKSSKAASNLSLNITQKSREKMSQSKEKLHNDSGWKELRILQ